MVVRNTLSSFVIFLFLRLKFNYKISPFTFPHQTVPYNLPNSPSNHYLLLYAHVLFSFKGCLFRNFFAFSFDVGFPSVCCEYHWLIEKLS